MSPPVVAINTAELLAAVKVYHAQGLALIPLPPGTKGPTGQAAVGWNLPGNAVYPGQQFPAGHSIGLAHAYSGTMALDVDQLEPACLWLQAHAGIDLKSLLDAPGMVKIRSGVGGHDKLLFRMPADCATLAKKAVTGPNGKDMIDFRCATATGKTFQDVLPPSIHPDTGKPYELIGDITHIPIIPAPLLACWRQIIKPDRTEQPRSDLPSVSEATLVEMLATLDPSMGRAEWIRVGMALHNGGEDLLHLWEDWSADGDNFTDGECETVWAGFDADTPNGVTLKTLLWMASQAGWKGQLQSAAEVFGAVAEPSAHLWDSLKAGRRIYTQAPELPLAIKGLLPARTVSALVGPPGQGKTQAAIQIGTALVTQTPAFLNPDWETPEQGACLIIDCEDDGDEFHRRIRAVVVNGMYTDAHQALLSEQLGWFYPGGKDIRMIDGDGHATAVVGQIIALLNDTPHDFMQLILGPTINLLSGDENDNAQVQALVNTWHRVYNETGVGVMGIHHTTKSATLNGARTQTSARGAGAFAGSVRAMLYLQNMTQAEADSYKERDHGRWCGLSLVKANGMQTFEEPVWLERDKRSAYMSYNPDQPKIGEPLDHSDDMVAAVAATARVLLATIKSPITARAFSDAHGGVHGPFGVGQKTLRHLLSAACEADLLDHTAEPYNSGGMSYTLSPVDADSQESLF